MNRITFTFLLAFITAVSSVAQPANDSIVWFSDMQFHSSFEKEALQEFIIHRKDTFNLFLAIDPSISESEAKNYYNLFSCLFQDLEKLKLKDKPLNRQIRLIYTSVHERFLKKYKNEVFFPAIFRTGDYNCVTASILYALVYSKLGIPYKVMASPTHVYLVANPGKESIVIETTNPLVEKAIFANDYKQQYVNHLKASKLISDEDVRNKSTEEIYEASYTQVNESSFLNLIGFQYYNKAIFKAQEEDVDESYKLIQKAYYFYPDPQAKLLLQNVTTFKIASCSFEHLTDIDYLAQLSRLKNYSPGAVTAIFNNIIVQNMQFSDKESFCDSIYSRLIPRISDKSLIEDVSFNYYLLMSQYNVKSDKMHYYIDKAVEIKNNHRESNNILKLSIQQRIERIHDYSTKLDSIQRMQKRYNSSFADEVLLELELGVYLGQAEDYYLKRDIKRGEEMLNLFEGKCLHPIEDAQLTFAIETAYQTAILYYLRVNEQKKASELSDRGLKYVPWSNALKKAGYN